MEASEAYENGLKHDPNNAQLKEAAKNIDAKMGMCFNFISKKFFLACSYHFLVVNSIIFYTIFS